MWHVDLHRKVSSIFERPHTLPNALVSNTKRNTFKIVYAYLCFRQLQRVCQVQSLRAHHVLLAFELQLQPFQLFRGEYRPHPFRLARATVFFTSPVDFLWKDK